MTPDEIREEGYEYFLSCVRVDEDVLALVQDIAAGNLDAEDLVKRFEREHVSNLTGRIEGRVWHDGSTWNAEAFTGPMHGTSREFQTEQEAAYWIKCGRDVPAEMVERLRANAGPDGADPVWSGAFQ